MKKILSHSLLLAMLLGSSIQAYAQYNTNFEPNSIRTGYGRADFCLGSEFQMKTGLSISNIGNIIIRMNASSLSQSRENRLIVKDNFGVFLNATPINLPYQSYPITVQVYSAGNSDICLNSDSDGVLENIEMEYTVLGPIPPQPPMSTVVGAITMTSAAGEVFGWGCDTMSRQTLALTVYINGIAYPNILTEGNLDVRNDHRMGLPDRTCGAFSGYKFQLPKEIMYGQNINIEVRGQERDGREKSFGVINYKTPIYLLEKGLFQVGNNPAVYFSNGVSSYCHVVNPDQLSLFYREGNTNPKTIESFPIGLRNDNDCELKRFPMGPFVTSKGNTQAVYFSNGISYCWIPLPGMIAQLAEQNGLNSGAVTYENLPSSMPYTNTCKAEGLFSVGPDVFYSNGRDAFCHVLDAGSIGNRKIYSYTQLPPDQRNDGNCH